MIQKRRRCLFFCPSCGLQAFALPHPLRISNAVSPRQHVLYINMLYRCVPRRRFGCHLPVVGLEFAKFVSHQDRRSKTSFSYIRPPAYPLGANKRCCKNKNCFSKQQEKGRKFYRMKVKFCHTIQIKRFVCANKCLEGDG